MPKPLRIPLPSSTPYASWTKVHDWGSHAGGTSTHDHLRLQAPSPIWILAACDGTLSIRPDSVLAIGAPFIMPWLLGSWRPPRTVSLYLNVSTGVATRTGGGLRGFLYRDLETSSLALALATHLNSVVIGGGTPPTLEEMIMMLIQGVIDVPVPAGAAIGLPAPIAPGGPRQFGLAAYELLGTNDPLKILDDQRDFVDDGQPQVDALLAALPPAAPLFETGMTTSQVIDRAATRLYPWSGLNEARTRLGMSASQWRAVGSGQKTILLERLRVRAGHGGTSTEPPFEFNDADLDNLFQLEAVAEFYANFNDPWAPGAVPVSPSAPVLSGVAARSAGEWVTLDGSPALAGVVKNHDRIYLAASRHPSRTYRIIEVDVPGHRVRTEGAPALPAAGASIWRLDPYQEVDLLDPEGAAAQAMAIGSNVLQLDGGPEVTRALTRVWPNKTPADDDYLYDTIYLAGEQVRPKKRFKIMSVDPEARTVTVDEPPTLAATSAWRIQLRPWLVCVDPIGGRLWGQDATTDPAVPGRVYLPSADLSKINRHFDTLYLPSDAGTPRRTYRIHEVNQAAHWVSVRNGPSDLSPMPVLAGEERWHLQAGVSGNLVSLTYSLISGRGYDHYDAVVFLVQGGQVHLRAPWTTYTSHNYTADYDKERSSVRGNKDYEYFSFMSGKVFINYGLKLVDAGAGERPGIDELFDGVREARFYYEAATRDDSQSAGHDPDGEGEGKTLIRFHNGAVRGSASESAGCLVSPLYSKLRSNMVRLYLSERASFFPDRDPRGEDPELRRLVGKEHQDVVDIYDDIDHRIESSDFVDKLVGRVLVIRPDERPL